MSQIPELFFCFDLKPGTSVSARMSAGSCDNMTVREDWYFRWTDINSDSSQSDTRSQLTTKTLV